MTGETLVATKIQLRRDSAADWTAENPILAEGEVGLESDTGRAKFGDGVTAWNSLSYRFESGGGTVTSVNSQTGIVVLDFETPTQLNVRDANNRNRTNHIGTQVASTISNFAVTVRATILTGLSIVNSVVTTADSVLVAIGKLQGQINRILSVLFYADFARNTTGLVQNTTTEADFLVLNTNIPADGDYQVDFTYEWSGNDGAQDIIVRLYENGSVIWTNQQEPKDVSGGGLILPNTTGGNTNSGTDQKHLGHAHDILPLLSGANQFKITLDSSDNGNNDAIYKGVISIKKFGVN